MGSIPALTAADIVPPLAGTSVGNTASQAGGDSGAFDQLFAGQIAGAGCPDVAVTETPEAPPSPDVSVVLPALDDQACASPMVDALLVVALSGPLSEIDAHELLDVGQVSAASVLAITESSALTVTSSSVDPSPVIKTPVVPSTPAPLGAVTLEQLFIAPGTGVSVLASAPPQVPTPLNTLEQLPRNGRPVEAHPDRASYFAVLPPSPLAQTQALLMQTLSAHIGEAASVVESAVDSAIDLGTGVLTGSKNPQTTGATAPISLTDLMSEKVQSPDSSVDMVPTVAPTSLLNLPGKSVREFKKPTPLTADTDATSAIPALSSVGLTLDPDVSAGAPGKQLVEQPVAARNLSRALPGAPHEESFIPTLAVPGDATALQVRATHLSRALPEAPHEESPIATLAVPGDATALQVRTTEPTPVSEHARLQDPLFRGDSLANTAPATATLITSAAAIPFATPSVNGGSNTSPTTLPNPLERNIARQLTQQLSAPLASLTNTGEQRKGAVDKTLIIRLTPPELGTVRIEISQRNGELIIRMHAEDPAVRQAIERMLPNLRTDLRQVDSPLQHITVESSSSDRNSGDRNSSDRNSDRNTDDRGAWQGQQQRHERAFDGGGQSSRREGERPVFSLTGMPASEPIAIVPRSRSLGGRSSTTGVDALA